MAASVIVKIQHLRGSKPNTPFIVFDQRRRVNRSVPDEDIPFSVKRAVMDSKRNAAYFHATIKADDSLDFGEEAKFQRW